MFSSSSITIKLDNVGGYFYQNQNITGSVELNVAQEKLKAQCLTIEAKGKDHCKFKVSKSYKTGEDKFLAMKKILVGSENAEAFQIPVGTHSYKFAIQLPDNIPASMEGSVGEIRYKLVACLKIPWSLDLNHSLSINVVRYEDFNFHPKLRVPVEREEFKTFCWLCCASEPLIMRVKLPQGVFALGQTIPVTVELLNRSSNNIVRSKVTLKKVEQFTTNDGTQRIVKSIIAENQCQGVDANREITFETNLVMPRDLMISNSLYSKKFKLWYEIRFCADIRFFMFKPKVHVPITIVTREWPEG